MECKDCKIVCNGKEVGTVTCGEGGIKVQCTEEGKAMCKECCGEGCC